MLHAYTTTTILSIILLYFTGIDGFSIDVAYYFQQLLAIFDAYNRLGCLQLTFRVCSSV
jgi:hypothetical protein